MREGSKANTDMTIIMNVGIISRTHSFEHPRDVLSYGFFVTWYAKYHADCIRKIQTIRFPFPSRSQEYVRLTRSKLKGSMAFGEIWMNLKLIIIACLGRHSYFSNRLRLKSGRFPMVGFSPNDNARNSVDALQAKDIFSQLSKLAKFSV